MGTILGSLLVSTGTLIGVSGSLFGALVAVTIVFGVLLFIASLLLYLRPEMHVVWGVVIIVTATASATGIFVGLAGLGLGIIGTAFGLIGGVFAISWRRGTGMKGLASTGAPYRICASCGRSAPIASTYCPFCGAPAMANMPPVRGEPPASRPR